MLSDHEERVQSCSAAADLALWIFDTQQYHTLVNLTFVTSYLHLCIHTACQNY